MKTQFFLLFPFGGTLASTSAGTVVYYSYNSGDVVVSNRVEDSGSETTDATTTEIQNLNENNRVTCTPVAQNGKCMVSENKECSELDRLAKEAGRWSSIP